MNDLYLFQNQFTEFPNQLCKVKNLKKVDLGANFKISTIPDSIRGMASLE